MHPAFLWPPGSPLSAPPAPRSTPHLSVFFHHTPALSQHSCIVSGFHLPLFSPHLPMPPLFPFPQNLPKPPTILARDSMCFSCRYLFTAWPVSTHTLIGGCSETIWAEISSSSAYSGQTFESLVFIQPQILIKL